MDQRLFPVTEAFFKKEIQPIIEKNYIWKGRPPEISHYKVFCSIMYVLRTGIPWRDLPKCYGCWHTVYQRFKRGSEKGIWWKILMILQQGKKITMNIVISDSSTFKMHRQGGGLKGGSKAKAKAEEA
jgi:transposase